MNIKSFTFNMFGVNTYLIWDDASREVAIIDPGMITPAEQYLIDSFIQENNLIPKYLINTHFHIDHTFGIDHIKTKYNLQVMGNVEDEFLSENIDSQARLFGIPTISQSIKIERPINDGDTIIIGKELIKFIHVPGHSPGSIVIYAPLSGFIISGDVLFKNSIGRTDLAKGNYQQLISGITKKLLSLPKETIVYPGHGLSTTIDNEIQYNPYI